ncbi:DUF2062 domain-containing protein [Aurantibacter crassamenti]|uniref:DUF2062 domain-containing protein n=1 Tax=Aurantibacter crassamenti TaxID=1837375 RepID=UPI001939453D|nr:DUF2062 domain-containing protein [Aurantibacter crassamenti]MBM1105510.1 DUF2062 domain-containing protein [Aurantibacter crassamenti]
MRQLKCCVIVPTYNNAKTLKRVLDRVLLQTTNIIIINDGSTDNTKEHLIDYSEYTQITLTQNKGKGNALRLGFKKALELGFEFAITIDSDGQHFPEDIPIFLDELVATEDKKILLIGSRNMTHESVPKKSSFGNKFSNFWLWVTTGTTLADTQSGFRLYPIKAMQDIKLRTNKFEFEIEAMVKSSWNGITLKNVPIRVLYDETERVSHYRPTKDFLRISALNTVLVLIALFYIKPRDLFRKFRKKGFKRFFYEDFLKSNDPPLKKALSIALGIFIGLSPLWGFHTILVITLAVLFKLNKVIAFAFSNVSMAPLIPIVVFLSLHTGSWVTGQEVSFSMSDFSEDFGAIKQLRTYLIGSFTLATVASIVFGLLGYFTLLFFNRKNSTVSNG